MKRHPLFAAILLSALTMTVRFAWAQDRSQDKPQKQSQAAKRPRVWTNDDLDSLRSPSDNYLAQQDRSAPQTAVKPTATQGWTSSEDGKPLPVGKPALSNPQTVAEADGMIAWEQRDIDAQQEYLERLRSELSEANNSEREHLQELIQREIRIIDETRKEKESLETQRDALVKKASQPASSAHGKSNLEASNPQN